MQDLVRLDYPTVDRLRLVQDNWNTHTPGSFYQVLPPDEALKFAGSLVFPGVQNYDNINKLCLHVYVSKC